MLATSWRAWSATTLDVNLQGRLAKESLRPGGCCEVRAIAIGKQLSVETNN
jgi:hypothetical protein